MSFLRPSGAPSPTLDWQQKRKAARRPVLSATRVDALPVPDLLHVDSRLSMDPGAVEELLELAFLGKEGASGLDRALGRSPGDTDWDLDLFAEDLFVRELVRDCFTLAIEGLRFPVNDAFLFQVLSSPPRDLEAVRFRQDILRELETSPELDRRAHRLYHLTAQLLEMFKAPDHAARLDIDAYRLDIFRQAKSVIDAMTEGFAEARSGLHRLSEHGELIRHSHAYRRLEDLLDFESCSSRLLVSLDIGADGEVKNLLLHEIRENRDNPFYQPVWKRWLRRIQVWNRGYRLSRKVIVQQVLRRVYEEIGPSLVSLVQVMGHLEVYLTALQWKRRMAEAGLPMCLPELGDGAPVELEGLFNPLLLDEAEGPVPCDVKMDTDRPITLITGPNSGGKTRLLQSLGLAQLLGQSGLYVPAARARLPLLRGMFVSLVETETADQAEGRLGREMLRIRKLFSRVGWPSLVVLDELCSGTNPREGVEIFTLVVQLLERLGGHAFISTHYLELAEQLRERSEIRGLRFLKVVSDDEHRSTYQFVPGVAETSLAAETARRLGVTFDELAEMIDRRRARSGEAAALVAEELPASIVREMKG
ncbi:MAG: hypothetical protein MI919_29535 [Holophagales bacterium]|nr:hypothetical protein [Holophagales bacterium]